MADARVRGVGAHGRSGQLAEPRAPVEVAHDAGWVQRHPFAAFVLLAYGISWPLMIAAVAGVGMPAVVLAVFGPMTAATLVTHWTGGSLRDWLRPVLVWRVPLRWWAYARSAHRTRALHSIHACRDPHARRAG